MVSESWRSDVVKHHIFGGGEGKINDLIPFWQSRTLRLRERKQIVPVTSLARARSGVGSAGPG